MAMTQAIDGALRPIADQVSTEHDSDVLLYNGPIARPHDRELIRMCCARRRHKNMFLVLVTEGGDADCAYRIARCLQLCYEHVVVFVPGWCKSAGTLVALGANELVIADDGELGPLDVQMSKKDSLFEVQSGLTVNTALTALQDKAYLAWVSFFWQIEQGSQGQITVKTAADIASNLTTGLFAPLYAQIDPMHVGEAAREMQVASYYGTLLMPKSKNYDSDSLNLLVAYYPSHGFVIDRYEAEKVFRNVRSPTEIENDVAEALGPLGVIPLQEEDTHIIFLSTELPEPPTESTAETQEEGQSTNAPEKEPSPEPTLLASGEKTDGKREARARAAAD